MHVPPVTTSTQDLPSLSAAHSVHRLGADFTCVARHCRIAAAGAGQQAAGQGIEQLAGGGIGAGGVGTLLTTKSRFRSSIGPGGAGGGGTATWRSQSQPAGHGTITLKSTPQCSSWFLEGFGHEASAQGSSRVWRHNPRRVPGAAHTAGEPGQSS